MHQLKQDAQIPKCNLDLPPKFAAKYIYLTGMAIRQKISRLILDSLRIRIAIPDIHTL